MPETAIAEPPPAAAPPSEAKTEHLKSLFDIPSDLVDSPSDQPTPFPAPAPEKKEEPAAPAPTPKAEEKTTEAKKDVVTARLAPDFSKKADDAPVPAATTDAELAELDKAIKDAPTEKARIDMQKFRDNYAAFKKENQELKSRPPAPAEDPQTKTLLESVTKERDELLGKVERYNLMESPKFQREFLQPRQKAFDTAASIVKEAGGDIALLQRAMALGGKARTDLLDEIRESIPSEMMKGRFDRQIEAIDSKTAEINEQLANSKRALEESRRQETVQTYEQREKQKKELEGLLGAAVRDLEENTGLECLKKTGKPEFKWHDDNVDEILKVAREVYLDATPEKAAIASVLAASAGTYRDWWMAERQASQAKDQIIAELKGAEPNIVADRQTQTVTSDSSDPESILGKLRSGAYKR